MDLSVLQSIIDGIKADENEEELEQQIINGQL